MCYGISTCTNGLYFDRTRRSQRIRHEDFIELALEDEDDLPPIVPHEVMSIDADESGFGRCGCCLELCPAERHVSPLSGFAHCDEECRGIAEDQLLNDMEQLEAERRVARLQLVLGIVDVELDERMANAVAEDSDHDEDEEVWEVDERQLALAWNMDDAVLPAPSTALDAAN